ncbi:hypothetical protein JTE90_021907 [Oedothorax gibbosus]|uniref:Major facilitator superfamily (MFS) profile domain-containing protein n=1 Tax=Oedothorax gibbosus TaxID=931172 RepID=A0AAV6VWR9_9ARAC|nr:hypothetical protein JTE90_021907 [Oedothorax gibbosus]
MEIETEAVTTPMDTVKLPPENTAAVELKVYKRRIWMLFLFSFLSMLSAMLFTHYTSIANVNGCFYNVSQEAVNWTGNIFAVTYIVLIFPVSSLIDYIDLKYTVLCASFFNTAACAVQIATSEPDSFLYAILSSFFGSLSNVFILGVPPFLAAKWFPSNELSRACAYGVLGNQLGVAFGFIFSPLMISSDCTQKDLISVEKRNAAYILTAVNAVVFILVMFSFQNEPNVPPSLSQAEKRNSCKEPYRQVVIHFFKNIDFILIFIMYGIMVASVFALSTNLNNLVNRFFPHQEKAIGVMGLVFVVAGLLGSIIAGYFLDYTKKFKETSVFICIASFFTFILFSCLLMVNKLWVQFISIATYGFFLTSFLPIGFEYGMEITYPLSESVCACLLNASTMLFGLILTEVISTVLDNFGEVYACAVFAVCLFLCCLITGFISKDYKRSRQNEEWKLDTKL